MSKEVKPSKKILKGLAEQKESKNKLILDSYKTSLNQSKLANADQSKIKTTYPKVEISKSARKSKYPIRDYYRLHRGLPRPPQ